MSVNLRSLNRCVKFNKSLQVSQAMTLDPEVAAESHFLMSSRKNAKMLQNRHDISSQNMVKNFTGTSHFVDRAWFNLFTEDQIQY